MFSTVSNWFSRRKGSVGIKRTEVRIVCCAALEDYWNNEQQKTIKERFYVVRFTDRRDNKAVDIRLNKADAEKIRDQLTSLLSKGIT